MDSIIEEIKNRLDIVDVVGDYLKLEKTGVNYRALCPFHSEKTPSFFVSPTRQIWKCFGCGAGGDIFKFVMMIEGIEFPEALKILAERAGVELRKYDFKENSARQRIFDINQLAVKFFQKQFQSKTGQEAKKYLLSRGINEESIEEWEIGYAPNKWKALKDFLNSKGYKDEEIEKAGLIIKGETGFYDRFRGRIIFPIWNVNSQVVGFGGRIFEKVTGDEKAKYLNIPNSLVYNKSRILYGIDKAKREAREKEKMILVEGYTDVIMTHQAGYRNTVATCGTALTNFHLKILGRYVQNLILCFDADFAGESATERGINLALSQGFDLKIARLPADKDPADLIRENPKLWQEAIDKAMPIMEFYFEVAFSKFDKNSLSGKKGISKFLLPVIKRIPNKIEQGFWIQRLARELRLDERYVYEELKKTETGEVYSKEEDRVLEQRKSKQEIIEENILKILLSHPDLFEELDEEILRVGSPLFSTIIEKARNLYQEKKEIQDWNEYSEYFSDDELEKINILLLEYEVEEEKEIDKRSKDDSRVFWRQSLEACQKELIKIILKERLKGLTEEIKLVEEEKNQKRLSNLIKEFYSLRKRIEKLNS